MFFLAFCALLYFLPSILGHDKRSFAGILILNLLLGWTVIGWVAALIWASTDEPRLPMLVASEPGSRYCCRCGAMQPAIAHYCTACGRQI